MNEAPFLNWIENLALKILWHSPRIGFMSVKQMNSYMTWYCASPHDCTLPEDLFEHPAMEFERMYHMPAYGEDE